MEVPGWADDSAANEEDAGEDGYEAGEEETLFDGYSDKEQLERPGLYVVATPIGNLGDITLRALNVLRQADALFAEDTRVLLSLLRRLEVPLAGRRVRSCHALNEDSTAKEIVEVLRSGQSVALVSDAGTPLISDPGYGVLREVRAAFGERCPIRPVPGACAAIAALSVAGLHGSRFFFAGFLSSKASRRQSQLRDLLHGVSVEHGATLVFYESPHRLTSTLASLRVVIEAELDPSMCQVVLCRELTKRYEALLSGSAAEVEAQVEAAEVHRKGEFVLLVEVARRKDNVAL